MTQSETYVRTKTFPAEYYTWNISDSMLCTVKNGQNGEIIQSPIFMMGGFKWMQELYPNGANSSSVGWSGWYLNLISFPPNCAKIVFQFKIVLFDECMDSAIVRAGRT
eukprot:TRINITY_DN6120_c0_g1_i1.p1 TRINITY_DN6120_c0_g1~~TRINITY_DN6120_c0_g1_i1.p1  ORF type:complete len:108 (+),score=25.20 TRINITY_DN6120_c0_g1_i1:179-502(+)